jgi:hypothetical protein
MKDVAFVENGDRRIQVVLREDGTLVVSGSGTWIATQLYLRPKLRVVLKPVEDDG